MDNKLNNEDTGKIRDVLERLTNILHKFKLPQDADTDESAEKAYPDILNALKQEHDVITIVREIKQLFSPPGGQGSLSTDPGVHDKEPFNAEVAGTTVENNCIDTPRNSKQETEEGMAMPSEDTHAYNNDEYRSKENNCRSTGHHENKNYLYNSQEFTNDEDILDLRASDDDDGDYNSCHDIAGTKSIAVDDDTSLDNPVTQEQEERENIDNINSETDINNLNKQHFHIEEPKESKEKKRSKRKEGTRNNAIRYCFSYLKTTCNKPKCNYTHEFPTKENMHEILKNLYQKPFFDLASSQSLKRRYGDCFAKAFSQRRDLKELVTVTMEFLQHSPKDDITDRIIKTTLNYFSKYYNVVNLTLYKNILFTKICPEKQVYMKLIERVLRRTIKNEDDFNSFKRVCLLLTNFIIDNCGDVNISTTEILINKICDVQYDQCLAKALMNVMRLTSTDIFRSPAIQRLEEVIKRDAAVYGQYCQLKEARTKKNYVQNDNIVSQVQSGVSEFKSTSTSNNLQYPSNENNETTDTTEGGFCHPSPIGSQNMHDSTIISFENTDDFTMRGDDERKNNNSRDRKWCIFNILGRCTRPDCTLRHTEPDPEEFKYLVNQTKQEKLFSMIGHQPTVKKYGKYLAQHFFEQNSTKQLVMLTVECLKLADIVPDIKTEVINITLRYFNRPDINVRLCEPLLTYKIRMKSVQSLLLTQLLSNEDRAQSTNALILLIDLISASKETFSYSVAESILKRVRSSHSTNFARAFIKVIRFTNPKILKHSLIFHLEELLATDKDLLEEYNVLKTAANSDVHPDQISNETASMSNVNQDIVSQKRSRTRSTEERSATTKSAHLKPAASIKRRRFTNHNPVDQAPGPSHVVPPLQHKKSKKINPVLWASQCSKENLAKK